MTQEGAEGDGGDKEEEGKEEEEVAGEKNGRGGGW